MERPLTSLDVSRWRGEFPILDRCTYLISNSLGAMPAGVRAAASDYLSAWEQRGVRAWHEGWWEMAVDTGDLIAPLLGVGAGQISMHLNVSLATSGFLSCFDYPHDRNRILISAADFPSLMYLADQQRTLGAELQVVSPHSGLDPQPEDLLNLIDERTRVVILSHVMFKTAAVQDAAALARRCREVGAVLLLDVYQSAGVLPIHLEKWHVHAAVGGCLKWLCGGPGNAFLWVDPQLAGTLEPRITGWQADQDPFAFRSGPIRRASGPWRFLTGTPNVPALHLCRPGLEIIRTVGIDSIRQRSLGLTERLIAGAHEHGFEVRTPQSAEHRGGTVSIWHPQAEVLCQGLLAQEVVCDFRPEAGIRFSPHFYNTVQECDRAIEALATLLHALS